jgi:hypothetical protein
MHQRREIPGVSMALVAMLALGCGGSDSPPSGDADGGVAGASGTGTSGGGGSGGGQTAGAGGTEYGGAGGAGTGGSGPGGSGGSSGEGAGAGGGQGGGDAGAGGDATICDPGESQGEVQEPEFVMNLEGQTGWFASPVVVDLDGDGSNELVAAYHSIYVFDSGGQLLDRSEEGEGRVYAPHVVADLDNDGFVEIVAGKSKEVWAWQFVSGQLEVEAGWPADTTTAGMEPEVRGLAAADLDGDGILEVVATTTQTQTSASGGSQVFVYNPYGTLYQPQDGHSPAWPRYNALTGAGNDADRNGMGHNGFGCYGLNVGIGNVDDDPEQEIIVTYDNHHIQAFDHDGVAIDASPWFSNRESGYEGQRMTWGQFIRWADPQVEEDHYHNHTGEWPHPDWAEWLQFTHSPPSVVDLDLDGKNEVLAAPNLERNESTGYVTQAYALLALEGAHGDGSRSAMRKPGWETLPRGDGPIQVEGWYPPAGVPAITALNLLGDEKPEVVVSLDDGYLYLFDAGGSRIWRFNYTHGKSIMYASEATVADLNQDGFPELLFSTFGDPDQTDSGFLIGLSADGTLLFDVPLPDPGSDGNGNGAPAAPAVGDLDGDGRLEIFVQTFDHGMDVFRVPGSAGNCLLWPTARGGPLRTGSVNRAP